MRTHVPLGDAPVTRPSKQLRAGEEAITHGVHDSEAVETLMRQTAAETEGVEVDYLAVLDPATFERPVDYHRDVLLAGAVRIGKTRLIDNIRVPRSRIPHTRADR